MLYDMYVSIDCFFFPIFLCEAEVYVYGIPVLTILSHRSDIFDNHFWVSISYTWVLSNRFERTEVFAMFLMMSCCDMFLLDHSGVFDQYCDLLLGYFLVARWRTIGYCDLSLMPSVADRELLWLLWFIIWFFLVARGELMWLLWLIFWCFSVACIGLRWFCDLWFHEPRVGYLCVVSGSGLQWGPGL